MAVGFRSSASVTNGTAGTSVTVTKPAGTVDGDLLLAFVAEASSTSVATPPAGWTSVGTPTGSGQLLWAFYRVASSEPSSWTWTLASSVRNWGWVGAYSSVDPSDPIADSSYNQQSSGPVFGANGVTIPRFGRGVSATSGVRGASGTATTWTPSGTERADLSTNGGTGTDISGQVEDSANPLDGAAGYGPTSTASQSQNSGLTWAITLNPLFVPPARSARVSVTVEAAFGADLTAFSSTWTWTDISTRMMGNATITRGRTDRTGTTQPTQLSLRLRNQDGALTPRHPASQWNGQWGRGTPVRQWINLPIGRFLRAQGRVASILPQWPVNTEDGAFVDVTVAGLLQPLGRDSATPHSALYNTILADGPVAYWPAEDGAGASSLAQVVAGGGSVMNFVHGANPPSLSSGGPPGSAPLVTCASDTQFAASVTPSSNNGDWSFEFYIKVPTAVSVYTPLLDWFTGGTLRHWRVSINPAGGLDQIVLEAFVDGVSQPVNFGTDFSFDGVTEAYGQDLIVTACATQSGSNILYEFGMFSATHGTARTGGSVAGTLGAIQSVLTGWPFDRTGLIYGHYSVWDKLLDASFGLGNFPHGVALAGYAGASATSRINSLAVNNNIPVDFLPDLTTSTATSTTLMGPQPIAAPLAGMRDAELADLGILADGLTDGLTYLTGAARYNLPTTMALDARRRHVKPSFAPVEDDQYLTNQVTVTRSSGTLTGSSYIYTDPDSPATDGAYPTPVQLNVQDDSTLSDQAAFRDALGTVPEMRVPTLLIDLRDCPDLMESWLAMDIGYRYTTDHLTDVLTQYVPGTLDQVLEYYVETLGRTAWRAQLTGSPFAPWRVFQLADDIGDTDEFVGYLDDDDQTELNADITATATSFAIKFLSGPVWTTAADDMGFDIGIGGERMTVTAVTGTGPQTITVTRGVNGYTAAHHANDPVTAWFPPVTAM